MNERLEAEWDVDEPSPDFASRVVAEAMRSKRRSPRGYVIAGVIVAAAAVAAVVAWPRAHARAHGDFTASARTELAIGDRAVAVLEPGAHVSWDGDRVEQAGGDVFYRVERGATFTVKTPSAEAQVLGTCFRISIEQENEMKRRDIGSGAIGAVVGVAVVIGVYEGKVRVSHADQAVTVHAGESATADRNGVRPTAIAKTAPTTANTGSARGEAEVRARLADLEKEKALLESELTAAYDAVGKSNFDLSPQDWAQLAERGELKYQYPCFQNGGFRPNAETLSKLGLPPEAADTIQKAYDNSNKRFASSMRPICAELAKKGEEVDMGDCIGKLFQAIYTKDPHATFRTVAEIRSGKGTEADATTPEMKMLLVFTGGMAPFEAELAKSFGAEEAHRLAYSNDMCFQAQSL
jgi:hypothetical protein